MAFTVINNLTPFIVVGRIHNSSEFSMNQLLGQLSPLDHFGGRTPESGPGTIHNRRPGS
jgi:hypothetical protein